MSHSRLSGVSGKEQALTPAVLTQKSKQKGSRVGSYRSTAAGLHCSKASPKLTLEKKVQRSDLLKVSSIS